MGDAVWKVVDNYTGKTEFSEENAQRNIDEIARFSKHDAHVTEEITRKFKEDFTHFL